MSFFLLGTRAVIREDFADTENLVNICLFSLISTSDFVGVRRSLAMGTLDTFQDNNKMDSNYPIC